MGSGERRRSLSCGAKCTKFTLVIFNIVFLVSRVRVWERYACRVVSGMRVWERYGFRVVSGVRVWERYACRVVSGVRVWDTGIRQ